jgi:PIN domain
VIILDSNQLLQAAPPDGALLGLLSKLAELTGHELALPQMVLDEHLARHGHSVQQDLTLAAKTIRRLANYFGKDIPSVAQQMKVEDAINFRLNVLKEIFTILPAPFGAEHEALIREANRRRPANPTWDEGKSGSGARDVVIWLTVLDAAKKRGEEVFFLSEDNDFGTDAGWHSELQDEATDIDLRLMHEGIRQLIAALATPTSEPENLMQILEDPIVVDAIASSYVGQDVFFSMLRQVTTREPRSFIGSSAPRMAPIKKAGKAHAYSIGELTWVCVRVQWQATKGYAIEPLALDPGENMRSVAVGPGNGRWFADVEFVVENTVLIAVKNDGHPVSAEVVRSRVLEFKDFFAIGRPSNISP